MAQRSVPLSTDIAVCLSSLLTLLLCISYLPIKSNSVMTVDLANVNFTYVYQDKLSQIEYEYIPRWVNTTGYAYRYYNYHKIYNGFYGFTDSMAYTYPKYTYILNSTNVVPPEIFSDLVLKDTNFCDEYAIGPWGYWAVSKTNGVSHSVNQPNLNRETLLTPYLEPYALKNHTIVKDRASIWDIVTEGGSTGEDDTGKYHVEPSLIWPYEAPSDRKPPELFEGRGLRGVMRMAIIFASIPFFLNLASKMFCSREMVKRRALVASISFALSVTGLFAIIGALIEVQYLIMGLLVNEARFTKIGVTWKVNHQMEGLLITCIVLCVLNFGTTYWWISMAILDGPRPDEELV